MATHINEHTMSVSKFKTNIAAAFRESGGDVIAVKKHNTVRFYAVPYELYEQMMKDLGAKEG